VNYTHCPAHTAAFPGSISVRPEVVTQLLADVLRGVAQTGFQKIFVLNGHSGNNGAAQMAISQVTSERKQVQVLSANWWETLTIPLMESLNMFSSGNGGRGHGGPLEMSSAAVFAPAGSVVPGAAPDLPAIPRMAEFPHYLEKHEGRNWPAYSGKLSEISREKGEKLVAIATEKLAALAEEWLKDDGRPGSW
jgi:creatinine amidohydrolase